jgi:hypothetical protein
MFEHSEVYHFNNEISLERKGCEVVDRFVVILKFDDELIVLEAFENLFNHANVV